MLESSRLFTSLVVGLASGVAVSVALFASSEEVAATNLTYARIDPAKLVTARRCGECHEGPYRVWKASAHAKPLATPERKAKADRIAGRMGFRFVRRDSLCLRCHYTAMHRGGQLRATSGVSCESCHGAAGGWIDIHRDYGEVSTADEETALHHRQRIARSRAAGMMRASDLYELFSACYECHTISEEKLIDVGGHSPGHEMELLGRIEKIRHNFLQSQLTGDGGRNEPFADEHRRLIYVAGRALSLEHTLRGLAGATHAGAYSRFMNRRLRWALEELGALVATTSLTEIVSILETGNAARSKADSPAELLAAADRISTLTRSFLTNHDGSELGSLDPLLPRR